MKPYSYNRLVKSEPSLNMAAWTWDKLSRNQRRRARRMNREQLFAARMRAVLSGVEESVEEVIPQIKKFKPLC